MWQSLYLDHVISNVYAKCYQNIPKGSRDRASFTFSFLEFEPRQTSTNPNLTISWATPYQYHCVCKISAHYSSQFNKYGIFHFFRIWNSAKPRPMKNDNSQSLRLDFVNIIVYAKVYQNIPNGLRVIDILRELSRDKIFTNRLVTQFSRTVRWHNQMFDYRAHSVSQPSVSVDFRRVVQQLCYLPPSQSNQLKL